MEECGLYSDGTEGSQAGVEGARLEGGRQAEGTFLCYLRDWGHITLYRGISVLREAGSDAANKPPGGAQGLLHLPGFTHRLHHYTLHAPVHAAIRLRRRQRRDKWSKAN